MDFVFDSEGTNTQQVSSLCIELQPPSHPWTIVQAAVEPTLTAMATPKGNIKEPPSTGRKNHTRSLASALSAFDMRTISPGTLLPAFSSVPSSPLSVSMLAPPEHRSLRFCFLFLHRLGRLLCLRHRTSSPWKVWVIRWESRACRWEGRQWLVWMGALGLVGGNVWVGVVEVEVQMGLEAGVGVCHGRIHCVI